MIRLLERSDIFNRYRVKELVRGIQADDPTLSKSDDKPQMFDDRGGYKRRSKVIPAFL